MGLPGLFDNCITFPWHIYLRFHRILEKVGIALSSLIRRGPSEGKGHRSHMNRNSSIHREIAATLSISPLFSTVQNLYLNNNRFVGQVPESFVDRLLGAGIQVLDLQHNFLTGIEINPAADIPVSSSLCLQFNCMVPPVVVPCPLKAGSQKARPTSRCAEWRG
ncbi:hypothetical protein MLD38_033042 [Melastoma candidum]|uniref:Uncharacterized protein n=1 Tax=Melastoma candidum TaxID=119954 RepID=A0ACB9M9U4_9MYRT|nr:hypothetical protein MLD38_033042 [Melastoma candidum]